QSVDILRPLMSKTSPSVNLRRAYASANNYSGFTQLRNGKSADAVKTFEAARETYRSIDGLAVGDLASAAGYAETSAWMMEALDDLGRSAEAAKIGEEAVGVATRVLEKSPAHMGAMRSRALLSSGLTRIYLTDLHPRRALALARESTRDWENLVRADP